MASFTAIADGLLPIARGPATTRIEGRVLGSCVDQVDVIRALICHVEFVRGLVQRQRDGSVAHRDRHRLKLGSSAPAGSSRRTNIQHFAAIQGSCASSYAKSLFSPVARQPAIQVRAALIPAVLPSSLTSIDRK